MNSLRRLVYLAVWILACAFFDRAWGADRVALAIGGGAQQVVNDEEEFCEKGSESNQVPEPAASKIDPTGGAAASTLPSAPQAEGTASRTGLDPSFAAVDLQQLFNTHPKTRDAQAKIEAERNATRRELGERMEVAKKALDELKKLETEIAGPGLSNADREEKSRIRQEKAADLRTMDREIREFQASNDKQLKDLTARLRAAIVEELTSMIAAAPGAAGATFVLDKSGSSLNGIPALVFSADRIDVTGAVLKAFGADFPKIPSTNPTPAIPQRGLQIASVDMKKIFAEFYKTKDAKAKIDEKRRAGKKELEERWDSYRKSLEETKGRIRQEKLGDPQISESDLREYEAIQEKQLKEFAARLRARIVDEITKVVSQVVEAEHADLVLDASALSLNGFPVFIYLNGVPDWSSTVIRALNSGQQGGEPEKPEPATGTVTTTELRFAKIDMKSVFNHLPATKKAEEAIKRAGAQAKAEVDQGADSKAREKELTDLSANLRGEIFEQMNKMLSERAARSGYQVVIDSSGTSLNATPVALLVGGDAPDLTREIVQALGGTLD